MLQKKNKNQNITPEKWEYRFLFIYVQNKRVVFTVLGPNVYLKCKELEFIFHIHYFSFLIFLLLKGKGIENVPVDMLYFMQEELRTC